MTNKPITTKVKVHFEGIKPAAWEHPADSTALQALKKVPGLDVLIKAVFGKTTEQSLRLLTLASAVRVSEKQFSDLFEMYNEACEILDIPEKDRPELFVSQSPILNAGAVGMDNPFITLNSSMLDTMTEAEVMAVLGHELGHILSGHVLYKTLLVLIVQYSTMFTGIPLSTIAIQAIIVALREWDRKSELSADRAGLLCVQEAEVSIQLLMKLAGGRHVDKMDLGEFIKQAEEYDQANSLSDNIHKISNTLNQSHPFPVSRVSELMKWIRSGEYDSILRGFYTEQKDLNEKAQEAASGYKEDFQHMAEPLINQAKEQAAKAKSILDGFLNSNKNS
ncbi:M48 family metallopeptidase [Sediminitomix flava]|uniref:Zn-dependent protease with chaperone function n=1 Tax=Sediminitomix flava TaxID=379075 RepID=A0A315ZYG8_SEDFL|nr:M48 family metallopeptidase [Sediminitomix flava]PWJ42407.1 Zn-dependent protease with chaperone function [Sediminitomix flava]